MAGVFLKAQPVNILDFGDSVCCSCFFLFLQHADSLRQSVRGAAVFLENSVYSRSYDEKVQWSALRKAKLNKTLCGRIFCRLFFFFKDFVYLFLERGEGEREGETHQYVVASRPPPSGDRACNPGMCPDWELNWRPFGSQAHAQSTELHQPELCCLLYANIDYKSIREVCSF